MTLCNKIWKEDKLFSFLKSRDKEPLISKTLDCIIAALVVPVTLNHEEVVFMFSMFLLQISALQLLKI